MGRWLFWFVAGAALAGLGRAGSAQDRPGSVRGVVYDRDFGDPLPGAEVMILERNQKTASSDQGTFVFSGVPAGIYTLVFTKEGYARQVRGGVVVSAGQLTDVEAWLSGEFTELDEFVVQDLLALGGASETALLALRLESPALLDSISADFMSKAGASDAAAALRLVTGATVQDGKFAVIRGLPDRYVSSQLNGARLPTADQDKRAVELDQFPAIVIESVQVTKTFTPDQQGDASGGAVDVRLKGIPEGRVLELKAQISANTQVFGEDGFLTYEGGGVGGLGTKADDGDKEIQPEMTDWEGAVGVDEDDAPTDYKWSATLGDQRELDNGIRVGGLVSVFYERDSEFTDDKVDDSYWVDQPGQGLVPETSGDGLTTKLFDVTEASEIVQWGGLAALGIESDNHSLGLSYFYSHTAEDKATLAIDTRGKETFFPDYDPNDPSHPGNDPNNLNLSPYVRNETLEYTERTTSTLQLHGEHRLFDSFEALGLEFEKPEVNWMLAQGAADLDQPDKRLFGAYWLPVSNNPGVPPFVPPFSTPETWVALKPEENINFGNLQRIWSTIEEDSDQYALDLKLPFEQWGGEAGYLKFGLYEDMVDRTFDQDTFSNSGDPLQTYLGGFDEPWSDVFEGETHVIVASDADVDYEGELGVSAWYGMLDLPLHEKVKLIAGARFESTDTSIVNEAEPSALWFPEGSLAPVMLNPGDADVDFSQDDVLPSIGLIYEPHEKVTLRAAYSQTVARQTFKELSAILQQEYLGGDVFIGNPDLQMSALENYDLRADYEPYDGGLLSLSWFKKEVEDPIEYVQESPGLTFTTPVNYPEGELQGFEVEVRQSIGHLSDALSGLSIGANATFIDSEVHLTDEEILDFQSPTIDVDLTTRDMTQAPEHLYNLYMTYDAQSIDTQFAVFYTVKGDTLVAGAGSTTTTSSRASTRRNTGR